VDALEGPSFLIHVKAWSKFRQRASFTVAGPLRIVPNSRVKGFTNFEQVKSMFVGKASKKRTVLERLGHLLS
jgi:hypothetical protein